MGRLIATKGVKKAKEELQHECIEGLQVLESMYKITKDTDLHLPILKALYYL